MLVRCQGRRGGCLSGERDGSILDLRPKKKGADFSEEEEWENFTKRGTERDSKGTPRRVFPLAGRARQDLKNWGPGKSPQLQKRKRAH